MRLEEAEGNYDLNKVAELRYGKIPAIRKRIKRSGRMRHKKKRMRLLREEVTEEEIADIVSRWTGIPVAKLVEGEREKLLRLKIIYRACNRPRGSGKLVSDALLRARAGIKDPNRQLVHLFS